MNVMKMNRKSLRGGEMMRLKLILTATALCIAGHVAVAEVPMSTSLPRMRSAGTLPCSTSLADT